MPSIPHVHSIFFLATVLAIASANEAHAYLILVDLNTYRPKLALNPVAATRNFACDGSWVFPINSFGEFTPQQWRQIIANCGRRVVTESHFDNLHSYPYIVPIIGRKPDDAMVYMEAREARVKLPAHTKTGEPGGTVLKPQQVTRYSALHGGMPLLVLTAAYRGGWKEAVDRALANRQVAGVTMEFLPENQKTMMLVNCIRSVHAARKRAYIFVFGGSPIHDTQNLIEYLRKHIPHEIDSNNTYFVVVNYGKNDRDDVGKWFNPYDCSVVANVAKLKTLAGYRGRNDKRGGDEIPEPPSKVSSTTLQVGARWKSGESKLTVLAKRRDEVVVLYESGKGFQLRLGGVMAGKDINLTSGLAQVVGKLEYGQLKCRWTQRNGTKYTLNFRPVQ